MMLAGQHARPPRKGLVCLYCQCPPNPCLVPTTTREQLVTEKSSVQCLWTFQAASSQTSGYAQENIVHNRLHPYCNACIFGDNFRSAGWSIYHGIGTAQIKLKQILCSYANGEWRPRWLDMTGFFQELENCKCTNMCPYQTSTDKTTLSTCAHLPTLTWYFNLKTYLLDLSELQIWGRWSHPREPPQITPEETTEYHAHHLLHLIFFWGWNEIYYAVFSCSFSSLVSQNNTKWRYSQIKRKKENPNVTYF